MDFAAGSDDDAVVVVMMRGFDALLTTQVAIIWSPRLVAIPNLGSRRR